jgi:hypothetical protein
MTIPYVVAGERKSSVSSAGLAAAPLSLRMALALRFSESALTAAQPARLMLDY